jgi:hypothetical protein
MVNNSFLPTFFQGYITGTVEAAVVFTALPSDVLRPLLPAGAALAPQSLTPEGTHPVYWSFNLNQRNVGTPIPFFTLNYHEFALVITDVYLEKDGPSGRRFGFPVVLYLNSWAGVLGGRWLWHLNKRHGRVSIGDSTPYLRLLADGHVSGVFERLGEGQPAAGLPHFASVRPLLDQDLLSVDGSGNLFSSRFTIPYDDLSLEPLQAEIMTTAFVPGLSGQSFSAPGINSQPMGAFRFVSPWKLVRCKKIAT